MHYKDPPLEGVTHVAVTRFNRFSVSQSISGCFDHVGLPVEDTFLSVRTLKQDFVSELKWVSLCGMIEPKPFLPNVMNLDLRVLSND